MDSKVIAVDFDGTLCTNNYPKIGIANNKLIEELTELRKNGHKLILWTCRENSLLDEAVMFCAQHGLYFDEVNNNIPERIEMYGTNPRKIGADLYIDDLSVTPDSLFANNYPIKKGMIKTNHGVEYLMTYMDRAYEMKERLEQSYIPWSKNEFLQIIRGYLTLVTPEYFWSIPASSSGKYHPNISLGVGGLVRHTMLAADILLELSRLDTYSGVHIEEAMAAILIHDTFKNGNSDSGHTVISHPIIASDEFIAYAMKYINNLNEIPVLYGVEVHNLRNMVKRVGYAVAFHMGQWYKNKAIPEATDETCGSERRNVIRDIVAMADYMASRKIFDTYCTEYTHRSF